MKIYYIFGILVVISLMALNGCDDVGEVVEANAAEDTPTEDNVEETNEEATEEKEEVDVKELLNKLGQEKGLWEEEEEESAETTEETTEDDSEGEETEPEINDISIENFRGKPEDMTIKTGEIIRWTNNMDNYRHEIEIFPQKNNSNKYETKSINDRKELLHSDFYDYTFEEAGSFKWMSRTKRDKVNGIITVEE